MLELFDSKCSSDLSLERTETWSLAKTVVLTDVLPDSFVKVIAIKLRNFQLRYPNHKYNISRTHTNLPYKNATHNINVFFRTEGFTKH